MVNSLYILNHETVYNNTDFDTDSCLKAVGEFICSDSVTSRYIHHFISCSSSSFKIFPMNRSINFLTRNYRSF